MENELKKFETTITQTIQSPYPLSSELEGYERVLPGAADRIFTLVEAESNHRRELEKIALQKESRDSFCGLIFAFIIAMTTTIGGGFLIYNDFSIAGSILSVSGVASIVGAFLRTRPISQSDDNNA